MLKKISFHWPRFPLLYVTAYFALAAVAVIELPTRSADTFWPTAGLLLVFGLLLLGKPFFKVFSWQSHLYLALQVAVITSLLLLGQDSLMIPMLFCVTGVMAPLALPLRSAALWIVAFALITAFYCNTSPKWDDGWMVSIPYAVGYVFCGASAYSLARTAAAQRELQLKNQQLEEYNTRIEELVVSQERNRLAREIHDALGHRLTVAAVQLEGAERLIPSDPAKAARMVNTVHEQVVEGLAELRRSVAVLRTPLEADLSLLTALARLTTAWAEATGIEVNRLLPEELPSLPDAHRLALYRAVQEALTNIQRHAQARQVWLELSIERNLINLLIKDDGQGFLVEAEQAGFGLRGLRERAAHLNGQFHVESSPGGGTQICFHLPWSPEPDKLLPPLKTKPGGWKLTCPMRLRNTGPEAQPRLAD